MIKGRGERQGKTKNRIGRRREKRRVDISVSMVNGGGSEDAERISGKDSQGKW